MSQGPIAASYWVTEQRLLAGEYPGAAEEPRARAKLRKLLDAGVTFFVDLTEPGELVPYAPLLADEAKTRSRELVHRRLPVRDLDVPSAAEMAAILDEIDGAHAAGHVVYVHCWGGVGRTGTVVGCHLVRHGSTGVDALARVQKLLGATSKAARRSPETEAQRALVRAWREPAGPEAGDGRDRYRGALLGLALGDALGTTLEFSPPGPHALTDLVGGGPFNLRAGQWTDDTSMALCLATSLVERGAFDPVDQLERYVRWWRHGYLSSTGRCFDIGGTTSEALRRFEQARQPYCGPEDPSKAGNGSLMRLAPVPLYYARSPVEAIERSGESSRTTHGALEAVDACRYFGGLLASAVAGAGKDELLAPRVAPVRGYWTEHALAPAVAAVADGSFERKHPPEIRGTGYVVACLEAALWAFLRSGSFREGALRAVNLGQDADTTGAVFGQLAGAFYGERGIPADWLGRLHDRERIVALADALYARRAR